MYKIYKITCLINGKIYIGQTSKTIERRLKEHLNTARNRNDNTILHKAMRKHGFSNFIIEEIEYCESQEEIHKLEMKWIDFYKSNISKYPNGNGYNLTDGGEGTSGYMRRPMSQEMKDILRKFNLGKTQTEDAKERISASKRGKPRSPETIEKISISNKGKTPWNKGKKMSEEFRRKNSESNKGRPSWNKGVKMSEQARENMRQSQLGKKQPEDVKMKRKLTWFKNGLSKILIELKINTPVTDDHNLNIVVISILLENCDSPSLKRRLKRMENQAQQLKEVS